MLNAEISGVFAILWTTEMDCHDLSEAHSSTYIVRADKACCAIIASTTCALTTFR